MSRIHCIKNQHQCSYALSANSLGNPLILNLTGGASWA